MSDLATLLTAIAALITAVGGVVTGAITATRTSKRERPAAVTKGAQVAEQLTKAAEDGEITPEELAEAMRLLREGEQP